MKNRRQKSYVKELVAGLVGVGLLFVLLLVIIFGKHKETSDNRTMKKEEQSQELIAQNQSSVEAKGLENHEAESAKSSSADQEEVSQKESSADQEEVSKKENSADQEEVSKKESSADQEEVSKKESNTDKKEATKKNSGTEKTTTSNKSSNTEKTNTEETTTKVKHPSGELVELQEFLFDELKVLNTNKVWGKSCYGMYHPEQLEYLTDQCNKWYKGQYTNQELVKKLYECPEKDVYDKKACAESEDAALYYNLEARWGVFSENVRIIEFKGYRPDITRQEVIKRLLSDGVPYKFISILFMYVRVRYDSDKDITYVYYVEADIKDLSVEHKSPGVICW